MAEGCVWPAQTNFGGGLGSAKRSGASPSGGESAAPTINPQRILRIRRIRELESMVPEFVFYSAAAGGTGPCPALVRVKLNTLPLPGSLCTRMVSPMACRISFAMDRPNPEPELPCDLSTL